MKVLAKDFYLDVLRVAYNEMAGALNISSSIFYCNGGFICGLNAIPRLLTCFFVCAKQSQHFSILFLISADAWKPLHPLGY